MESIRLIDGLILTIVSMMIVFFVLGAIAYLIDAIAKFIGEEKVAEVSQRANQTVSTDSVQASEEYQFVAEMMALVLASEDKPNCKFEVVESKRIK